MSIHLVWGLGIPLLLILGSSWVIRYFHKRLQGFLVLDVIAFAVGFLCGTFSMEIINLYANVVGRIPMPREAVWILGFAVGLASISYAYQLRHRR